MVRQSAAAPNPYVGYPEERISSNDEPTPTPENLQTALLGGEWIGRRKGSGLQQLGLLSWEKDFVLERPARTIMNALVESDGSRLTLEFSGAVNPYVVLIAEYPFFYGFPEGTGSMAVTRFRGLGMGTGILKRTPVVDVRLGGEWVSGKLDGDVKETGRKTMEFVQLERDRTRKTKRDEPMDGTRLLVSLSGGQFHGFASEPEKTIVTVQGTEEWYHPLSERTTFGLVAREGAESRSARFWTMTVGSFQEDDYNIPLPGYLYQQFTVKGLIDGEAGVRFEPTSEWSLQLGYHAAGGWSPHVYSSVSAGATYLLFHQLPLNLQGAWGFSPLGAVEILAGTALQW